MICLIETTSDTQCGRKRALPREQQGVKILEIVCWQKKRQTSMQNYLKFVIFLIISFSKLYQFCYQTFSVFLMSFQCNVYCSLKFFQLGKGKIKKLTRLHLYNIGRFLFYELDLEFPSKCNKLYSINYKLIINQTPALNPKTHFFLFWVLLSKFIIIL